VQTRSIGFAIALALGSAACTRNSPPAATGQVDWTRLGQSFAAYVANPSAANANAVSALVPPVPHVAHATSPASSAASRTIDDGLSVLQRQVEACDQSAVRLAFDLGAITDGEAAEGIDIMLGKLIPIDPRLFLSALQAREQRVGEPIPLGSLVGNLGPDFVDEFQKSCVELRLRASSLQQVNDHALDAVKTRAVENLNAEIGQECH
jgi:cytochrome c5